MRVRWERHDHAAMLALLYLFASAGAQETFRRPSAMQSTKSLVHVPCAERHRAQILAASAGTGSPPFPVHVACRQSTCRGAADPSSLHMWGTCSAVPSIFLVHASTRIARRGYKELMAEKNQIIQLLAQGKSISTEQRAELLATVAQVEEIEAMCANILTSLTVVTRSCALCFGACAIGAVGGLLTISHRRANSGQSTMSMNDLLRIFRSFLPGANMIKRAWQVVRMGVGILTLGALSAAAQVRFPNTGPWANVVLLLATMVVSFSLCDESAAK